MNTKKQKTTEKRRLKAIRAVIVSVVLFVLVFFLGNAALYEIVFARIGSESPRENRSALRYETFPLSENHETVEGYLFLPESGDPSAVAILSRGLNAPLSDYDPLISHLLSKNAAVVSYDYRGYLTGQSLGGLPETIRELSDAVSYAKTRFPGKRIALIGHSVGAYASGALLSILEDADSTIDSAILYAPFDRSSDMLEWKSKPYVGFLAPLFVPIIRLYETLKFGAYATLSVSEGALKTSVPILVLHGDQDEVIPMSYGIGSFETILAVDRDVTLRYLPDTGHQITGTGIPVSEFDLFLGL